MKESIEKSERKEGMFKEKEREPKMKVEILVVEDIGENQKIIQALVEETNKNKEKLQSLLKPYHKDIREKNPKIDKLMANPEINIDIAPDYATAMDKLQTSRYDVVISDMFFPFKREAEGSMGDEEKNSGEKTLSLGRKVIQDVLNFYASGEDKDYNMEHENGKLAKKLYEIGIEESDATKQPLGALIAEEAFRKKIPVVIASSESGHGGLAQPVIGYLSKRVAAKYVLTPTNPYERTAPFIFLAPYLKDKSDMNQWKGVLATAYDFALAQKFPEEFRGGFVGPEKVKIWKE